MAKKQLNALAQMYKDSLAARKILDYWSGRKQHRDECLVSRTAKETALSEEEVKNVFRDLEAADFGKYIKSSRGGQARFAWGSIDSGYGLDFSLISVGRVAQGHQEPFDDCFSNPDGSYEDEDEGVTLNSLNKTDSKLMTIRTDFRGVTIRLDLPMDFDPQNDLKDLSELIAVLAKNKRK